MSKISFNCNYCGFTWTEVVYSFSEIDNMTCSKCGDKNVEKKKIKKIDYYGKTLEETNAKD